MATSHVQTACPHCKKSLKLPEEYLGRNLRCKGCNKTFLAKLPASKEPKTIPQREEPTIPRPKLPLPVQKSNDKLETPLVQPSPAGQKSESKKEEKPLDASPHVKAIARQQRTGLLLFLTILVLGLGAVAAGVWIFKDQMVDLVSRVSEGKPIHTQPTGPSGDLLNDIQKVDTIAGDTTKVNAPDPAKRSRRNARIPGPYPGRALLIGIRNYLYLNPLNPAYRPETSFGRDPLGLHTLRRVLVSELAFPREQVVELSDEDDHKPTPPTKATIEATIEEFLKTCRSVDRILLVFAGHAAVIGEQAYVLPIEAELPPEGAKPDAERDAKLAQRMISVKWLYEKLHACPARQKLMILDVSQTDPETGIVRNAPGPMDEKLFSQLKAAPVGVEVWLPCKANQQSHLFSGTGQYGSVFMDSICQYCTISTEKNWKFIERDPGLKAGRLPMLLLLPQIHKETSEYVKRRGLADQSPVLFGTEANMTPGAAAEPPPPATLKIVRPAGDLAKVEEIDAILKELNLEIDPTRRLPTISFPLMQQTVIAKYLPASKNTEEDEEKPLRAVTIKAMKALSKAERSFRMEFKADSNEARFKKMIEKEQETPASVIAELYDVLEEMKKAVESRDEESSKRWQAHFDYTQVRLLAKLAQIQEYNFVLGNKLRKDTPTLKDSKNHNGWAVVPQRKMEQKETRGFDTDRQKIAAKIIKDYPGTPWEVLARREQATVLGLTLQETKID